MMLRLGTPRLALVAGVGLSWACASDRVLTVDVPRDSVPPHVQIVFPDSASYDEDGDRFLDLRVVWGDSGTGLDLGRARVTVTPGVNGSLGTANLLLGWDVTKRDSSGLVAHENIWNLVRGGFSTLKVTARDRAGNTATDSIILDLPHGAFFDSISMPYGVNMLTVCSDDHRVYATGHTSLMVADADELTFIGTYDHPGAWGPLRVPLCIPGDSTLYVTLRVERFNRRTNEWMGRVDGTFTSTPIIQSKSDPNFLYVGESGPADVAVIDRELNQRIGTLGLPPVPGFGTHSTADLATTNNGNILYVARYGDPTIVYDLEADSVITRLNAVAWRLLMSPDGTSLYALNEAFLWKFGVVRTWPERDLRSPGGLLGELGISPSGRRLFVTTQSYTVGGAEVEGLNYLFDENLQVLASFPRPFHEGHIRYENGVAFHPNGKLVFVGRSGAIDVYLNRE